MRFKAGLRHARLISFKNPSHDQGAIALLQSVAEAEVDGFEFPSDLIGDEGQKIGKSWSFYLHKNVAKTFATHIDA